MYSLQNEGIICAVCAQQSYSTSNQVSIDLGQVWWPYRLAFIQPSSPHGHHSTGCNEYILVWRLQGIKKRWIVRTALLTVTLTPFPPPPPPPSPPLSPPHHHPFPLIFFAFFFSFSSSSFFSCSVNVKFRLEKRSNRKMNEIFQVPTQCFKLNVKITLRGF